MSPEKKKVVKNKVYTLKELILLVWKDKASRLFWFLEARKYLAGQRFEVMMMILGDGWRGRTMWAYIEQRRPRSSGALALQPPCLIQWRDRVEQVSWLAELIVERTNCCPTWLNEWNRMAGTWKDSYQINGRRAYAGWAPWSPSCIDGRPDREGQ